MKKNILALSVLSVMLIQNVTFSFATQVYAGNLNDDNIKVSFVSQNTSEEEFIKQLHNSPRITQVTIDQKQYISQINFENFEDDNGLIKQYRVVIDKSDKGKKERAPLIKNIQTVDLAAYNYKFHHSDLKDPNPKEKNYNVLSFRAIKIYAITDSGNEYLVYEQNLDEEGLLKAAHKFPKLIEENHNGIIYLSRIKFEKFDDDNNLIKEYRVVVDGSDRGKRIRYGLINDVQTVYVALYGKTPISSSIKIYAKTVNNTEYLIYQQ